MRKLISLGLGIALASTVFAAVPVAAESAVVARDQRDCVMLGAGPDGGIVFGGYGSLTHVVQNDNHAIMTCKGRDLVNESGRTQHFSGLGCLVERLDGPGFYEVTYDMHSTLTKKGRGTLNCKATFPAE